jgi:hypothetical protein
MVHLAHINEKEYYLCHTLDKTEEIIASVAKHVVSS